MNPLTLLPLLAAAAFAAPSPAGVHYLNPASTTLLAQPGLAQTVLAQPAVARTVIAQPALTRTVIAQPAVAQVQVPLTQHIHYENRAVVTGVQSTVIKPALAAPATPLVAGLSPALISTRQLPGPPADVPTPAPIPGQGGDGGSSTTQSPIGDSPTPVPVPNPPIGGGENGSASDNPLPIPGVPLNAQLIQLANPSIPLSLAAPVALAAAPAVVRAAPTIVQAAPAVVQAAPAVAVAAPAVATVRAAQAGDFEPLVTKEKVLAPVRTHTEITPQLTQIQPEIQVRRVIQEVPVATPVAVQTPVIQQVAHAVPSVYGFSAIQAPFIQTAGIPAASAQIIHA